MTAGYASADSVSTSGVCQKPAEAYTDLVSSATAKSRRRYNSPSLCRLSRTRSTEGLSQDLTIPVIEEKITDSVESQSLLLLESIIEISLRLIKFARDHVYITSGQIKDSFPV